MLFFLNFVWENKLFHVEQFIREREKPGFSQVDSLRRKAREAERKEDSEEEGKRGINFFLYRKERTTYGGG